MINNKNHQGIVTSAFICSPIAGVEISLLDKNDIRISSTISDKNGMWSISIPETASKIVFEKNKFTTKTLIMKEHLPNIIRLLEDSLIGYLDKLGYSPGETLRAFVHSTHSFHAELIRHGLKSELIADLGDYKQSIQTVPDDHFVTDGLNWSENFNYKLPDNLQSGLYTITLSESNTSEKYSITFVLSANPKNRANNSRILVLASTNNWQTYNIWGGRSRYRNFENPSSNKLIYKLKVLGLRFVPENIKAWIKKSLKGRAVVTIKDHPNAFQFRKLSIKRPHPNCSIEEESVEGIFTSHLAAGEWRILAWLEKEGYNYDLISGYQLHTNPETLKHYDAFILSTHCEYWSKEMFNGVKNFYNEGGAVLNLSGNSIYREVEFYEDGSLHCTSLRFAVSAEDESQLIGVRFDMRGYGSCAPFKTFKPDHWAFKGTAVRKNDLFAKKSLNYFSGDSENDFNIDPASMPGMAPLKGNGGSGWETDKVTKTSPPDITLLAKGTNRRRGGADMIIREPEGKGIMFSASSITFGGCLLIDDVSSKIVNNVLKKCLSSRCSK